MLKFFDVRLLKMMMKVVMTLMMFMMIALTFNDGETSILDMERVFQMLGGRSF